MVDKKSEMAAVPRCYIRALGRYPCLLLSQSCGQNVECMWHSNECCILFNGSVVHYSIE